MIDSRDSKRLKIKDYVKTKWTERYAVAGHITSINLMVAVAKPGLTR